MSITITIAHNSEYCREHNIGKRQDDECMCVGGEDNIPSPNCYFCKGKGILTTTDRPFAMNITDENFVTMWQEIGIQSMPEPMGQVSPHKILSSFSRAKISEDDLNRHQKALVNICNEAMKRGEMVEWA